MHPELLVRKRIWLMTLVWLIWRAPDGVKV